MSGPTSPEQAINQALVRLGYPEYLGSIWDGTRQARAALQIYGQTRDQFLRQDDFDFAERNVVMTLLKQAPPGGYIPPVVWSTAYPSLPWMYSYAYPSDCLKVRAIRGQALFVFDFDPGPVVYVVENDNSYTPARKVINCNIPSAILTYTGQITDLTSWEPDSVEAFIAQLAARLAPALRPELLRAAAEDEMQSFATAEKEQG
jgi:hypothetical protein